MPWWARGKTATHSNIWRGLCHEGESELIQIESEWIQYIGLSHIACQVEIPQWLGIIAFFLNTYVVERGAKLACSTILSAAFERSQTG